MKDLLCYGQMWHTILTKCMTGLKRQCCKNFHYSGRERAEVTDIHLLTVSNGILKSKVAEVLINVVYHINSFVTKVPVI